MIIKYLVFGGPVKGYTDHGGWVDYLGHADTFEDARILLAESINDNIGTSVEVQWAHIVNVDKDKNELVLIWSANNDEF